MYGNDIFVSENKVSDSAWGIYNLHTGNWVANNRISGHTTGQAMLNTSNAYVYGNDPSVYLINGNYEY